MTDTDPARSVPTEAYERSVVADSESEAKDRIHEQYDVEIERLTLIDTEPVQYTGREPDERPWWENPDRGDTLFTFLAFPDLDWAFDEMARLRS